MDVGLYVVILVLFASWVTVHAWLCWTLARIRWWKGCVALVVPPLAPFWGQRTTKLVAAWISLFLLYGAALIAGLM